MTLQLAAYHEAGHAVAVLVTNFHTLPLPIRASASGHGELGPGLSRRRCAAASKQPDPADPDIARELALIACAGFQAEDLFAQKAGLTPDPSAATDDETLAGLTLKAAHLPVDLISIKLQARALMETHWNKVDVIAKAVLSSPRNMIDGMDAYELLELPIP